MDMRRSLWGRPVSALLILTAGFVTMTTAAGAKEAGDWLIRVRAIGVVPNESSTITPIGGAVKVGEEYTAEVDFSYFFTDNIAAELILATSKHKVRAVGTAIGDIPLGNVWLLPPTLNIQYHFLPKDKFSPYVGGGINLTLFYASKPGPVVAGIQYKDRIGFSLQGGVDIAITERTYLNLDLKKLFLGTDVRIDAGALGIVNADVDLNPWIFGVGVGWIF